jgi:hypothetical protein
MTDSHYKDFSIGEKVVVSQRDHPDYGKIGFVAEQGEWSAFCGVRLLDTHATIQDFARSSLEAYDSLVAYDDGPLPLSAQDKLLLEKIRSPGDGLVTVSQLSARCRVLNPPAPRLG